MPELFTVGQLADAFGVKVHQIVYAIEKLSLQPVMNTGNARLFGAKARDRLREEFAARHAQSESSPVRHGQDQHDEAA